MLECVLDWFAGGGAGGGTLLFTIEGGGTLAGDDFGRSSLLTTSLVSSRPGRFVKGSMILR